MVRRKRTGRPRTVKLRLFPNQLRRRKLSPVVNPRWRTPQVLGGPGCEMGEQEAVWTGYREGVCGYRCWRAAGTKDGAMVRALPLARSGFSSLLCHGFAV